MTLQKQILSTYTFLNFFLIIVLWPNGEYLKFQASLFSAHSPLKAISILNRGKIGYASVEVPGVNVTHDS